MQTGHSIAEARWEAQITQQKLAEISGIAQADISRMERGQSNPTIRTLERVAAALGYRAEIRFVRAETK